MIPLSLFSAILCDWFTDRARDLPWRATYAPYHVWISEVMLQQTQMDRAVNYFTRWIARFPDAAALAAAHEDEVLKYWEGLGYYNRARNLHRAARVVAAEHGGEVPRDHDALRALPGVGPYTAGAVMSLAFNEPRPIVDANVERVFARVFDIDAPVKTKEAKARIWDMAEEVARSAEPRVVNQAVMEFGALVCSKKPDCPACPLADHCEALRLGIVADRPVLTKPKEITHLNVVTGVLLHEGKYFIQKRLPQGAWAGLWEFPGGRIEPGETPEEAAVREFAEETGFALEERSKLGIIKHGYTTYRVTLHCHLLAFADSRPPEPPPALTAATEYRWATRAELDGFAFPAGHRKLIDSLQDT